MTILIDTSGSVGHVAVAAAAAESLRSDLELMLVGDQHQISQWLAEVGYDPAHLEVCHAPVGVSQAARKLEEIGGGALVTAAPSEEVVAAARTQMTLLEGAKPALCAVYPTARRRGDRQDPFVLILDVGASFEASDTDLYTYARMGAAYASRVSRNHRPKVAVLAQEIAGLWGPAAAVEALSRLEADTNMDCVGAVGGNEVCYGASDVIVTSGFVGNTVARLLEGVGEVARQVAESAQDSSVRWRMAYKVVEPELNSMLAFTDWKEYGGAPLLGYDKPVLVADPTADVEALQRAIRLAAKAIRLDVVGAVAKGLGAA